MGSLAYPLHDPQIQASAGSLRAEMVETVMLTHALARLEALLRAFLTPQQYRSCATLLPALHAAVGLPAGATLSSRALEIASSDALRQRYHLTGREAEVLRLLLLGRSNAAIAHALRVSEHTARHHTERVLRKVHVHSRAQLAAAIGGRLG